MLYEKKIIKLINNKYSILKFFKNEFIIKKNTKKDDKQIK